MQQPKTSFPSLLFSLGLFFVFVAGVHAQVPAGATMQEVIDLVGWPKSTSRTEDRVILNYPDFTIVMEDGRVTSLQFKSAKHKAPESYLLHPPKAGPAIPVTNRTAPPEKISTPAGDRQVTPPTVPKSSPTAITPPSPPSSAVDQATPPPVDFWAEIKTKLAWIIGLFFLLATMKVWFGRSAKNRRREVRDSFPPPPHDKRGEKPLVLPRRHPHPNRLRLQKNGRWHS